ncbi:MAG: DUF3108 domain-containing protein [bacterium]
MGNGKKGIRTIAAAAALAGTLLMANTSLSAPTAAKKAPAKPKTATAAKQVNYTLPLDEALTYSIKMLGLAVATQTNTTKGIVDKDGTKAVDIFSAMKSSPWVKILSIDNSMETFMDAELLVPVRYEERANEKDWKAVITYKFFKDRFTFNTTKGMQLDQKENGSVKYKARPQDQFSLMYYVRQLDLAPGKTFNIPCVVDNAMQNAVVKVLETRKIKTAFGEKEVFYVTSSIGEAKFFIGTDKNRIPYQFEVKINVGTMKAALKEYKPESAVK